MLKLCIFFTHAPSHLLHVWIYFDILMLLSTRDCSMFIIPHFYIQVTLPPFDDAGSTLFRNVGIYIYIYQSARPNV